MDITESSEMTLNRDFDRDYIICTSDQWLTTKQISNFFDWTNFTVQKLIKSLFYSLQSSKITLEHEFLVLSGPKFDHQMLKWLFSSAVKKYYFKAINTDFLDFKSN